MTDNLKARFARQFSALRRGCPQEIWAKRYGLTFGAVKDLEQGRVLPSRAMVVLMHAIQTEPMFMQQMAKAAKEDLAALDEARSVRN